MPPSTRSPELGDDFPAGFQIWQHEIYPGDAVGAVCVRLDRFLESPSGFHHHTPGFIKWFHIPTNHMNWVESFFRVHNGGACRLDEELWTRMLRPESSGNRLPPVHATHMQPAFLPARNIESLFSYPLMTLYLPYMNWETCHDYCALYEVYHGHEWPLQLDGLENGPENYPALPSIQRDMRKLHPRRTLDQFMYPFLRDTTARDIDQTVSRWTSEMSNYEEVRKPDATSRLIMVDQLWCWVLDDATVLTCFPSHYTQYHHPEFHDLYNCIREESIHCESAQELCVTIACQAVTHLITPRNQRLLDPIGIYQQATSKKTTDQISLFQKFQQNSAEGTPSFNDQQDFALLRDAADIIDELKMIDDLIKTQFTILGDMETLARESRQVPQFEGTERVLHAALENVRRMTKEADRTHSLILQLLDLKQKAATLSEARSTAQQGRAVMLFTIVTVIFLPLSFFTSYYGQNVSEITGDGSNPSTWDLWKVGMPISLAIILLALCIAFLITRSHSPLGRLRIWLRIWRSPRGTRDPMGRIARIPIELPDRPNQAPRASTPELESMGNPAVYMPESRPQRSTLLSTPLPPQTSASALPSDTPGEPESEPDKKCDMSTKA